MRDSCCEPGRGEDTRGLHVGSRGIEELLMRNWVKQEWWATVVARTESKVAELCEKVVVLLTRDTLEMVISGAGTVFGILYLPPAFHHCLLVGGRSGGTWWGYWNGIEALLFLSTTGQGRHN